VSHLECGYEGQEDLLGGTCEADTPGAKWLFTAVVAVLVARWCSNDLEHFDLNWHIVEDANVTEEERYEFSGRRIVPTEDAVRGGDDSSGAPWHASEVDSTSTASTARAVRAEEGEARALAALHAERAAREAAEANVARLMALLAEREI
jgi:hypothetical protein